MRVRTETFVTCFLGVKKAPARVRLIGDAEQPAGAHGVFIGDRTRVAGIEIQENEPSTFEGSTRPAGGPPRRGQ
jgi:hypothetical protein